VRERCGRRGPKKSGKEQKRRQFKHARSVIKRKKKGKGKKAESCCLPGGRKGKEKVSQTPRKKKKGKKSPFLENTKQDHRTALSRGREIKEAGGLKKGCGSIKGWRLGGKEPTGFKKKRMGFLKIDKKEIDWFRGKRRCDFTMSRITINSCSPMEIKRLDVGGKKNGQNQKRGGVGGENRSPLLPQKTVKNRYKIGREKNSRTLIAD